MSLDPVASRLAATGVAFAPEITAAGRRYGLDPQLLAAVAAQETGGPGSNAGHNIVGDGGHGRGLFQIDDRWHAFASTPAAMEPTKNADYAARMISGLLKQYGGNVREALSAYNSGSPTATGTMTRWADGSELSYADSVLRHYRKLDGKPDESPQSTAIAESGATVASVGTLSAQAQRLPMPMAMPIATRQREHTYHREATNYQQLFTDDADETDS
jgi:soluble lytic murein transglycosylase-like protein